MEYTLFSKYDEKKERPIKKEIEKKINVNNEICIDDVYYKVIKKYESRKLGPCLIVDMVRYKINNTTTTIVHKCPALNNAVKKLDEHDFKKLKEKYSEKKINDLLESTRTKMKTMGLVNICPTCGVIFYKDNQELPESIEIESLKNKVQLKKRV